MAHVFQGVCLGSGIGSFEEVYNTSLTFSQKGVSPFHILGLLQSFNRYK